jgi:hypothetical protein
MAGCAAACLLLDQQPGARSGSGELLAALSNPGYQRVHALDAGWARDIERFFLLLDRREGRVTGCRYTVT